MATRKRISAASLGGDFVLFPRALSPHLYDRIISYASSTEMSIQVVQEARQMQTIIGLVAGNLGVSIVPVSMRRLAREDVRYIELSPATPRITTEVVWNPDNSAATLQAFLSLI